LGHQTPRESETLGDHEHPLFFRLSLALFGESVAHPGSWRTQLAVDEAMGPYRGNETRVAKARRETDPRHVCPDYSGDATNDFTTLPYDRSQKFQRMGG